MTSLILGTDTDFVVDIHETLKTAELYKQEFVVAPLFHPRFRRDSFKISDFREGPGTRSDRVLPSKAWVSNVVGKISEWIDLDNVNPLTRKAGEGALKQELLLASHLGLQAILLPPPGGIHSCVNYARFINQSIGKTQYQQFWLTIPLIVPLTFHKYTGSSSQLDTKRVANPNDGWTLWDNFRFLCNHSPRLSIALEISGDLPDSLESLARWRGEPVKAIIIPTKIFLTNKTGYPVLAKRHQQLISMFLEFRIHIIIRGRCRHEHGMTSYHMYIRHLHTKLFHPDTTSTNPTSQSSSSTSITIPNATKPKDTFTPSEDRVTMSYRDYLQAPLQPLMDNLESQTYEVFESDPVKYRNYEEAITLALQDLVSREQQVLPVRDSELSGKGVTEENHDDLNIEKVPSSSSPSRTFVVAVVGAGRGPLVQCTLNAATRAQASVLVYAIEKNANAVITLRNRCLTEGWRGVTVIATDMRSWKPTALADVMVSELLGSWGDNELSPECLDGAQVCLKLGGISIPVSYTSYLAPLSAPRLWTNAREILQGKGLDTPYVVKLHNCYQLAPAQPLFTFTHPQPPEAFPVDNTRYAELSFVAPEDITVHGLSGTFYSILYRDVTLSIEPTTHSQGMFSWFPLFIPLSTPVRVFQGDTVTVNVWRCCDERKVWYEWCLSTPVNTPIQNPNGTSYWIGL